ncbi:hypothetical protein [Reichenbachiella versicolor]|uniref:hypothetical protein n=1 Tax=Reichenbachiella versicolor TaxID=1821036 RepID=UPI000D6E9A7C|nr:hypothetical protein [Reichenbachiella versicolor]
MKAKILERYEINDQQWNDCVENCTNPLVYNLSWYLDIVCEKQWYGIVIENSDQYLAILPVPFFKKYTRTIVRQPIFTQQLGISSRSVKSIYSQSLLLTLIDSFDYINPLHLNNLSSEHDFLNTKKLNVTNAVNHILPLREEYRFIESKFRRDRKKDIRKAKEIEQKIIASENIFELFEMFNESVSPKLDGGLNLKTKEYLTKIAKECFDRKIGKLLYTQHPDKQIGAGAFFILWKNRIIYLIGASYNKYRKLNGRSLIIQQLLLEYSVSDFIFDFESPHHAPEVAEYYQSFGATKEIYPIISYENLPLWITTLRKAKKSIIEMF